MIKLKNWYFTKNNYTKIKMLWYTKLVIKKKFWLRSSNKLKKLFKRVILVAVKNYKSRVYEFTLRTGEIPHNFALQIRV